MFKGLINIQEIDLSEFDSSQVISMAHMFEGCSNLKKINFGNMDTSNVKNMEYLFYGCSELENLDLSNFDTSLVINMRYMFALLFDLKYLALSENFKTSNVVNMAYMFYYTTFLTTLDLSMFNTSQVKNMSNMFSDAWSLNFLLISNFDTSKVETIENMFKNCFSLYYLDIKNFDLSNSKNINGALQNKNKNLKICIDDDVTINYLLGSKTDTLICSESCIYEKNVYINKESSECVQSCGNDLFLYDIFCYKECPQSTKEVSGCGRCQPGYTQNKRICEDDNFFEIYDKDKAKTIRERCFYNCKKCHEQGDEINNNCEECKSDFMFLNDTESINNNCYEICPIYYYFDQDGYRCIKAYECNGKLIVSKKRCIDDCKNDNIYKIEFKNYFCIENCPVGTIYNETMKTCVFINNVKDILDQDKKRFRYYKFSRW